MILGIKTDQPTAELFILDNKKKIKSLVWQADKKLSKDIFLKIDQLLSEASVEKKNLKGVIIFKGPGSFTGLRIGFTVANTMAYSLNIPVSSAGGKNWLNDAMQNLDQTYKGPEIPVYGGRANITKPKK